MVEIQKINIKGVDNEIVDFNARVKIEALEDGKQDKLTFDTTPRPSSINPVTSDGIYHAIQSSGGTQSDWNETDPASGAYIKNKPSNSQFQGDWAETDTTKLSYIKNKHISADQIDSVDASKLTGTIDHTRLKNINEALDTMTNVTVTGWVADTTYSEYPYKASVVYTGITASFLPMVVYSLEDADSGSYAPICESGNGVVYIWSDKNTPITIPSISATKVL